MRYCHKCDRTQKSGNKCSNCGGRVEYLQTDRAEYNLMKNAKLKLLFGAVFIIVMIWLLR